MPTSRIQTNRFTGAGVQPTPGERQSGELWFNETDRVAGFIDPSGDPQTFRQRPVLVTDTLPVSPEPHELIFLTSKPVGLYVWYDDGDSEQWVQVSSVQATTTGSGPAFPANAKPDDLFYLTSGVAGLYIFLDDGISAAWTKVT